jgi:tripartite-type tricarboxylate transporter receptor subunit TctC
MPILDKCLRFAPLACLVFSSAAVGAQSYPNKVVRYLIPDAPGSGSDTIGRIVVEGLIEAFGQQVIVDNRPGAGTTIGFAIGAKAPPDGYTLIQNGSGLAAAPSLYRKLPFDPVRDFEAVTQIAKSPQLVVVHPSVPVRSIRALVELAKSKPGAVDYASAGTGSSTFFAMEVFKERAGIDAMHVPYRTGGAAITSIVSGETSVYFAPFATALPHVKSHRLRPLAVTTLQRLPLVPDLPTVAESGYPGYEAGNWYGVLVPAGTPREIVESVHRAVLSALQFSQKRLAALAYIPVGSAPKDYAAYIRAQMANVADIYKRLGLTPTR